MKIVIQSITGEVEQIIWQNIQVSKIGVLNQHPLFFGWWAVLAHHYNTRFRFCNLKIKSSNFLIFKSIR